MAEIVLENGVKIGDFQQPYIVAEVNTSHRGSLDIAREMILKAKEVGCDCVKFQSWSAESLYSATYYAENPIAKRIVSKFALSEEELVEMAKFCKASGISFASTPYSKREVDVLVEKCNVPFIKVASMDINNDSFLAYIARTGFPIVLATGMADMDEIERAVAIIEDNGNHSLCLLHCVSIYPPKIPMIHLNNILGLRKKFPQYPIGFSDHSLGMEMAVASTALGTSLIEKHFTLDKKKMGMDNNMAMEPDEIKGLVDSCQNVFHAMGSYERVLSADELEQRKKMRRSIVAARDLKAGLVLREGDLDVKRPGDGIPPGDVQRLQGKKLIRDVAFDTVIREGDVEWGSDGGIYY